MVWLKLLGGALIVSGVVGFLSGLGDSRRNNEARRGLILWMLLAWVGVALEVVAGVL